MPVVELMVDYLHRPVCHEAFFRKYASKKFLKGEFDLGCPIQVWESMQVLTHGLFSIHAGETVGKEISSPLH